MSESMIDPALWLDAYAVVVLAACIAIALRGSLRHKILWMVTFAIALAPLTFIAFDAAVEIYITG